MEPCDGAVYDFELNGHRYIFIQDQRVEHLHTHQLGILREIERGKARVYWGTNDNKSYETWEYLTDLAVKEYTLRRSDEGVENPRGQ